MFCPISDLLPNGMYAPVTILTVCSEDQEKHGEVSVVHCTRCLEEGRKGALKGDPNRDCMTNEKLF